MADSLHRSLKSMSLEEEEEPLTLPDSPTFRVLDDNALSLLGKLLNPDCQNMDRMIDYMPTAWRLVGRVRGIALSCDKFQFIFDREEDLQTVLNDRPWSYNHWTMVLERWTPEPPEDFLRYMEVWVRIRHIPANFFTLGTMFALAKETGRVLEIAYDPKISHKKDYILALVSFDTEKPAKASRKLTVKKGVAMTIGFEYERIHKRCFHCHCLTHEKPKCPLLRKGHQIVKEPAPALELMQQNSEDSAESSKCPARESAPPGFPTMFPELPPEERKMAMLYISHSDDTERLARIQRVKQSIEDQGRSHVATLTRFTSNLDKGKGHVFSYAEKETDENPHKHPRISSSLPILTTEINEHEVSDSALSANTGDPNLAISTDFQVGTSCVLPAGGSKEGKQARRRPPSWKRKSQTGKSSLNSSGTPFALKEISGKRKPESVNQSPAKKPSVPSTNTVASSVKPLQFQ
ncbi:uncharacterized protein LOC108831734 [Raphanus sativus]|uniref:Uncharacterized protein LOC108831734 n=1 Tax=Raphanus sativus TaxID=3726 RepID=A0A6J0LL59_RAPSA|nr:uncharacterized protein LOC108831734 [Raphanus sativus]